MKLELTQLRQSNGYYYEVTVDGKLEHSWFETINGDGDPQGWDDVFSEAKAAGLGGRFGADYENWGCELPVIGYLDRDCPVVQISESQFCSYEQGKIRPVRVDRVYNRVCFGDNNYENFGNFYPAEASNA